MSRLIAFSGGCFSGKTTTLKRVKSFLEDTGHNVVVLDELIRTATDKPIDEIRKDASAYFELQNHIIRGKIAQESLALANDDERTVYLADRAITDSLFYLQNYVNKNNLSRDEIKKYCRLHTLVLNYAKCIYDAKDFCVLRFTPLSGSSTDKYRPENLDHLKYYEHEAISLLNDSFKGTEYSATQIEVNLNRDTPEDVFGYVSGFLIDTSII